MNMEKSNNKYNGSGRREPLKARSILRIFITALSALKKPAVAIPSVIYLVIQVSIMVLYLNSTGTAADSLWNLFISSVPAGTLGHYPHRIILMQPVLSRLDVLFDIFVHVIFQGAVVLLVYRSLSGRAVKCAESFLRAIKNYPRLLVISLISSGAVFLIVNASRYFSRGLNLLPHIIILAAGVLCGLALQACFLYSLPLVLLKDTAPLKAIKTSFSIAWRHFPVTLLAVALPFILTLPTVFLDIKAEMISLRLSPDFMIYNHLTGEVLRTISTYLVIAGSTVILGRYLFGEAGESRTLKERNRD